MSLWEERRETETYREKMAIWWQKQRLKRCIYKLNTIKECQQTAEARREKEAFYPSSFRGNTAYADILVSDFLASTTVRWYTSVVLSSQFLVLCYSSLRELIQWVRRVHSIGSNENMHHHIIKIKTFCALKGAIKGEDNRWLVDEYLQNIRLWVISKTY